MVDKPTPTPGLQREMTLVMPLADPSVAGIAALAQQVFLGQHDPLKAALDDTGTVHFARFVVIGSNLVMASSYDGEFRDYIFRFIHEIGAIFNKVMRFVVDPPTLPVEEHPLEFVDWVHRRDIAPIGFYSAYEGFSVQQIRHSLQLDSGLKAPPPPGLFRPMGPALPADQVDDIQGLILRGFGHPLARHFVLSVVEPGLARKLLGDMADLTVGDGTGPLRVTVGTSWGDDQPKACWAVGITATGLERLGVPAASRQSFPAEFREGAVARATVIGDVGRNAPAVSWLDGLADSCRVHLLLSLYAADDAARTAATASLEAAIAGACEVVVRHDAGVFPAAPDSPHRPDYVHFGYRDNISQPRISGDPVAYSDDGQPLAPPGEFVLGYECQFSGITLDVPAPKELGKNGSFSAFRILEQDVVGFEAFLDAEGATTGLGKEKLAAKVLGRWRNGIPLALSPDTDTPTPPISDDRINNFMYGDDMDGVRCPIGSHIRRAYPRDQPMHPTDDNIRRRIMRRAMPYGPEWKADSREEQPAGRGLIGHFIGANITMQFETVMGQWVNGGMTHPSIAGANDVILGGDPSRQRLEIPTGNGAPVEVTGFGPFVTTRGGIYAFLPSRTALAWIGNLPGASP